MKLDWVVNQPGMLTLFAKQLEPLKACLRVGTVATLHSDGGLLERWVR